VSTNQPILDPSDDRTVFTTATEPVRWWIPLVASTGALLVLIVGAAALVSGAVNATLDGLLG